MIGKRTAAFLIAGLLAATVALPATAVAEHEETVDDVGDSAGCIVQNTLHYWDLGWCIGQEWIDETFREDIGCHYWTPLDCVR